MSEPPTSQFTRCPRCQAEVIAIIPEASGSLVEQENDADGMVRVNCNECGEQFRRYYQIDE